MSSIGLVVTPEQLALLQSGLRSGPRAGMPGLAELEAQLTMALERVALLERQRGNTHLIYFLKPNAEIQTALLPEQVEIPAWLVPTHSDVAMLERARGAVNLNADDAGETEFDRFIEKVRMLLTHLQVEMEGKAAVVRAVFAVELPTV